MTDLEKRKDLCNRVCGPGAAVYLSGSAKYILGIENDSLDIILFNHAAGKDTDFSVFADKVPEDPEQDAQNQAEIGVYDPTGRTLGEWQTCWVSSDNAADYGRTVTRYVTTPGGEPRVYTFIYYEDGGFPGPCDVTRGTSGLLYVDCSRLAGKETEMGTGSESKAPMWARIILDRGSAAAMRGVGGFPGLLPPSRQV